MLPFTGGGSSPVQYELEHGGHRYYLRYKHSWLTIDVDDVEDVVSVALAPDVADDGAWSDEETNVYLSLIGDAIRADRLASVELPAKAEVAAHPLYKKGPLPRYHL